MGELWDATELLARIHGALADAKCLPAALAGLADEIKAAIPVRIEDGPEPRPDSIPTDFGLEEGDYEMIQEIVWVQGGNIAVRLSLDECGLKAQMWPCGSLELDPVAETRLDFVEAQALVDL